MFAFQYAEQQSARAPSIDPTPKGSGKGLVGLDGAGEAAMILRKVGSLGKVFEAALRARYGEKITCCANCSSSVTTADFKGACHLLTTEVAMQAAPNAHERLVLALVMRHFLPKERKASLEAIGEMHSHSVHQVKRLNPKISEALKRVEARAQAAISDKLIDDKLLPKSL